MKKRSSTLGLEVRFGVRVRVRVRIRVRIRISVWIRVIPEPTARSAVPGTNSARLFTPGETKALAKSKVHQ